VGGIIGHYGGLIWQYFPEARDEVIELIARELRCARDDERQPEDIPVFDYTIYAVLPVIKPLGSVVASNDLVQRFCLFCRAILAYSGPDAMDVDYHFRVTLLEYVDIPDVEAVVRVVDPELVDLVRARYGKWK